ncbi:MAG: hypothetical protein ACXVA0_22560 [Mucilaginibacter sp.]
MAEFEKAVIKNYKALIAIVTLLGSAFGYFSSATCDSLVLKFLLIAILGVSCFFFSSLISRYAGDNRTILIAACILVFVFLSVVVYLKKCPVADSGRVNIDKSVYNDHSTHINVNKLPQRTLNGDDIAELNAKLPDKRAKVLVQYLKNNTEDTLLCQQIISNLVQNGYTRVVQSEAFSLPNDLMAGKLTIRRNIIDADTLFKVIINPQQ